MNALSASRSGMEVERTMPERRCISCEEIVDDVSRSTEKIDVMGMDGGISCTSYGLAPQTVRVKQ